MNFVIIITNNVNEQMWICCMFTDEIENVVFSINGITYIELLWSCFHVYELIIASM
jgi:hypothetical protein